MEKLSNFHNGCNYENLSALLRSLQYHSWNIGFGLIMIRRCSPNGDILQHFIYKIALFAQLYFNYSMRKSCLLLLVAMICRFRMIVV